MSTQIIDRPANANQRGQRGASPIAGLESRATTASATASAPVSTNGSAVNFSAQYFFDRFIANDESEITKLDIVRAAVSQLSFEDFKRNVRGMVAIANEAYQAAKKEAIRNGIDVKTSATPEMVKTSARLKTAQNHQTVMRNSFGALRLAEAELTELGVTRTTGYREMNIFSKQALEMKGIKWDGSKVEAADVIDARRKQSEEMRVMEELKRENPIQTGESIKTWNDRIMSMLDTAIDAARADKAQAKIDTVAKQVLSGNAEIARDIALRIIYMLDNPDEVAEA